MTRKLTLKTGTPGEAITFAGTFTVQATVDGLMVATPAMPSKPARFPLSPENKRAYEQWLAVN